jgi:hypothetical protein
VYQKHYFPVEIGAQRRPSDDKEDINKSHKPASCFATLDVDFLNPFREDDKLHLAENVFYGTHKDDMVYPLSAQEISKHQRKDLELIQKLRDTPGYSDTALVGMDLITYHDRIYIPHALRENIVEWYHSTLGHPGEKRTVATVTQHFIWPKIHEQVATHVSKCKACQVYKGQKKKYGHLPVKDVEAHPWQTLCVNLIGPYMVCTKKGTQS